MGLRSQKKGKEMMKHEKLGDHRSYEYDHGKG